MVLVGRDTLLEETCAAIAGDTHVVLVGPRGSGRTALLHHVGAALVEAGRTTHLVAGRDGAAGIPLASAAPVVAAVGLDAGDRMSVYTRLPSVLRETGAVVLVDDVEEADPGTLVLLAQMARARIPLVLTTTDEERVPHGVRDALASARRRVLHLPPLGVDDVLRLAADLVGDELDVPSAAWLVRAGQGLPELLCELVRATGSTAERSATGVRLGDDLLTEPLRRRVARALDPLTPGSWEVVRLVAAVGWMPEITLDLADVEAAVVTGALRRVAGEGGTRVEPADVVVRTAVLEQVSATEVRGLRARARSLLAGLDRPDAVRHLTLLAVTDGEVVTPEAAEQAARQALAEHRGDDAVRLVGACGSDDRLSPSLLLLRGRARSTSGDLDGAAADLARAARTDDRAVLTGTGQELGLLHAVRRGDPAAAVREVLPLHDRLVALDPGAGRALAADLVKWHLMAGLPVPPLPGVDELSALAERISLTVIGAMIASLDGPVVEAHRLVDDGLADVAAATSTPPHAEDLLLLSRFLGRAFGGDVDGALALALGHRDRAVLVAHPAVGMWEYAAAELCLHVGDLRLGRQLSRRAVRHLRWQDFTGLRDTAQALGEVLDARVAPHADAPAVDAGRTVDLDVPDVKVALHRARLLAGHHLAAGRRALAGTCLADVGARALAESHAHLGLMAIDEAFLVARDPAQRRELAACLTEHGARSPLFAALAARAVAVLARDPRGLEAAAGQLAEVGLRGRQVQALELAADVHEARGAREAGRRLREQAAQCRRRGVQTWPVHPTRPSAGEAALSPREVEIVRLAAGRARSREIADRLGLSVRTVDNHLSRIYHKLGVTGRADLEDLEGFDEPGTRAP